MADGDDLEAGRTNTAQSGTEIVADVQNLGSGNDFVLQVRHDVPSVRVGAIRGIALAFGVNGISTGGASTGVVGTGKNGVEGQGRLGQLPPPPRLRGQGEGDDGGTGVIGTGHNGVEGRGDGSGVTGIGGQRGVLGVGGGIGIKGEGRTFGVRGAGLEDANGFIIEPLAGVQGTGITGVQGVSEGPDTSGAGVEGFGGKSVGVRGHSDVNDGVQGDSAVAGKSGVFGFNSFGISSTVDPGFAFGVFGSAPSGVGVGGRTDKFIGVHGVCVNIAPNKPGIGMLGENQNNGTGVKGTSVTGNGVRGESGSGVSQQGESQDGVSGQSEFGNGVTGRAISGFGVYGESESGTGVGGVSSGGGFGLFAESRNSEVVGLLAQNTAGGPAASFFGDVQVQGNFTISGGLKSAAVPHPDGSHRLLYCMESPESWFEDFGEGQLVNGQVEVRLDPDFAVLVEVNGYHVFITPYGESKGLFVSERHVTGFRVCEQQGGTSNLSFAYRVVAKRKDIVADRLAKATLHDRPSKVQSP
jgi:hypothetical protein